MPNTCQALDSVPGIKGKKKREIWAKAHTEGRGPSTDARRDVRESDTPSADGLLQSRARGKDRACPGLLGTTGLPAPPGQPPTLQRKRMTVPEAALDTFIIDSCYSLL